jgi:uncharacterized membrane protein YjfL (UPF0719 family)
MPLAILRKNERDCPSFVCDHCGEEITSTKDGNYQWVMSADAGYLLRTLHYTHKRCSHAFEQTHPLPDSMMWGAMGLADLIPFLMANLGITFADIRERRKWQREYP